MYGQCDQIKIAKCLKKLPKNDFTIKMIDFKTFTKMIDFKTFTKMPKNVERFGQINCCQRL